MASHSSVPAWRIPGTGSLVGCHLWGRTESDTTEATLQQQQQHIYKNLPKSLGKIMFCEDGLHMPCHFKHHCCIYVFILH